METNLTEYSTSITAMLLATTPDGELVLTMGFEATKSILAIPNVPPRFIVEVVDLYGGGALAFGAPLGHPCRVKVDADGEVVALGHSREDRWVDLRLSLRFEPGLERGQEDGPGQAEASIASPVERDGFIEWDGRVWTEVGKDDRMVLRTMRSSALEKAMSEPCPARAREWLAVAATSDGQLQSIELSRVSIAISQMLKLSGLIKEDGL